MSKAKPDADKVTKMSKKQLAEAKGGLCGTLGDAYKAARAMGTGYSFGYGASANDSQSTMVMSYRLENGYLKIVGE